MEEWKAEALKKVNAAAKDMRRKILSEPDNKYNSAKCRIEVDLVKRTETTTTVYTMTHSVISEA